MSNVTFLFFISYTITILKCNDVKYKSSEITSFPSLIICQNNIDLCEIICDTSNSCNNINIYSGAKDIKIQCTAFNTCHNMLLYIGLQNNMPNGYNTNDFQRNQYDSVSIQCDDYTSCDGSNIYINGNFNSDINVVIKHINNNIPYQGLLIYCDINGNSNCNLDCSDGSCKGSVLVCVNNNCQCSGNDCNIVESLPTETPTDIPTQNPSYFPSKLPSVLPSELPSIIPSESPSESPTMLPTELPTLLPSESPIKNTEPVSETPTTTPSHISTSEPSITPTTPPTPIPTNIPTEYPSMIPSIEPTVSPSLIPTFPPIHITSINISDYNPINTYDTRQYYSACFQNKSNKILLFGGLSNKYSHEYTEAFLNGYILYRSYQIFDVNTNAFSDIKTIDFGCNYFEINTFTPNYGKNICNTTYIPPNFGFTINKINSITSTDNICYIYPNKMFFDINSVNNNIYKFNMDYIDSCTSIKNTSTSDVIESVPIYSKCIVYSGQKLYYLGMNSGYIVNKTKITIESLKTDNIGCTTFNDNIYVFGFDFIATLTENNEWKYSNYSNSNTILSDNINAVNFKDQIYIFSSNNVFQFNPINSMITYLYTLNKTIYNVVATNNDIWVYV